MELVDLDPPDSSSRTHAENQVTEQAAQIQNLILQGYDAIVLNAASPTALNGTVSIDSEEGEGTTATVTIPIS